MEESFQYKMKALDKFDLKMNKQILEKPIKVQNTPCFL
jgi:hypothetical protein